MFEKHIDHDSMPADQTTALFEALKRRDRGDFSHYMFDMYISLDDDVI